MITTTAITVVTAIAPAADVVITSPDGGTTWSKPTLAQSPNEDASYFVQWSGSTNYIAGQVPQFMLCAEHLGVCVDLAIVGVIKSNHPSIHLHLPIRHTCIDPSVTTLLIFTLTLN